ncbi:MAG: hypothetical protein ACI38Z_05120 [Parafannyhessea sp.]|uniref:hypothetical protein n=1 Tax=Parafannyhessea sp. TaxID=2847324 RepID=UPI003F10F9A2
MDLVVADASGTDLRIVDDFSMDMAFGSDENSFTLTLAPALAPPAGGYVYVDGTEYGGVADSVTASVRSGRCSAVEVKGRTWHGILAGKVLTSGSGSDPLTVSGAVGDVLGSIVARVGLSGIFRAETGGTTVSHTFDRFQDAWSGILDMLSESGMRPEMVRGDGMVTLRAVPAVEWADAVEESRLDFDATSYHRVTNHLVCAGTGENEERTVVDLYADSSGNVSQRQTLTGVDEIAQLYDYSSADSDKLVEAGTKKLRGLQTSGKVKCTAADDVDMAVGDMVRSVEGTTGLVVEARVTKKKLRVTGGRPSFSYEAGQAALGTSAAVGLGSGGSGGGASDIQTVDAATAASWFA